MENVTIFNSYVSHDQRVSHWDESGGHSDHPAGIQWYPTLKTNWINGDIMGILLNKRILGNNLDLSFPYIPK